MSHVLAINRPLTVEKPTGLVEYGRPPPTGIFMYPVPTYSSYMGKALSIGIFVHVRLTMIISYHNKSTQAHTHRDNVRVAIKCMTFPFDFGVYMPMFTCR